MPIVPKVSREVRPIGALPGVRHETRVSSAPVEGMADAVRGIAGVAVDIGQQVEERNDVAVMLQARRDLSEWEAMTFNPGNEKGIAAYKGGRALQAEGALLPGLDKRMDAVRSRLSNRQRAQFEQIAEPFKASVRGRIQNHTGREHEGFIQSERKASIGGLLNDAVTIGRDGDYGTATARLGEALAMQAAADQSDGMVGSVPKENQRKLLSSYHAQILDGLLVKDPITAQEYANDFGRDMTPDDYLDAQRKLAPLVNDRRADEVFGNALKGGPQSDSRSFDAPGDGRAAPTVPPALRSVIEQAADRHGVPRNIALGMAEQESQFNPRAVGPETEWGTAKGLFQYLDNTAGNLGINPLDPAQAADAAMRTLAEQAKRRGWDWAIAHHHAGPDPKQHGPKTHAYVEAIRAKARRYGDGSPGAPALAPAADEAEVHERIARERDPALRRLAEQKAGDFFRTQNNLRQAEERDMEERIHVAVWTTPNPHFPLSKVLTPNSYAYAVRKNMVGSLETNLMARRENKTRTDNRSVVGEYLDLARTNPDEFAKMSVTRNARHMTAETEKDLIKMQEDVRSGKGLPDFANEAQQLSVLVYSKFGIVGEAAAAKRAPIEAGWYQMKKEFSRMHQGRNPSADEREVMMSRLARSYALSGLSWNSEEGKWAGGVPTETIPATDREQILSSAHAKRRKAEGKPLDEPWIRSIYLSGLGAKITKGVSGAW